MASKVKMATSGPNHDQKKNDKTMIINISEVFLFFWNSNTLLIPPPLSPQNGQFRVEFCIVFSLICVCQSLSVCKCNQQYLSCFRTDFDKTSKLAFCDHL